MLGDEFGTQYMKAFDTLQLTVMEHLLVTQRELQTLASTVTDDAERERAFEKVHRLPEYFGLKPASLERLEAEIVLQSADLQSGTREERLAAISAVGRKIQEIADRAGDDAHQIRYMTRRLDAMERDIEFSNYLPWSDDYDQGPPAGPADRYREAGPA
ncbi:hypothetical protein AB0P21_36320 [Kribbella sp. NPDC056861]|uniref:hypothetical protein n=1 Tax=Kribbella sp. NPDC056861 TaxID=3154857 RepID=UPI00341C7DA6